MRKFSGAIRHFPKFRGSIIWDENTIPVFPVLPDPDPKPIPWFNWLDVSGYYYSNTNDSSYTNKNFAVGEFPLTRTETGKYSSGSSALQVSSYLYTDLTTIETAEGDTVEFEYYIPTVTFTGVTYPHQRFEISLKDPGLWGSYSLSVLINWDSANSGLKISNTSLFSSSEVFPIVDNGQVVGFKGSGVLAKTIGKLNTTISTGAFSNTKPVNWTTVVRYSSYDDFRIRIIK